MFIYGKALLRIFVLCCLIVAAVVLSKPAAASAFQDCCQTCQARYQSCLSGCTTSFCRTQCNFSLSRCMEVCPACL